MKRSLIKTCAGLAILLGMVACGGAESGTSVAGGGAGTPSSVTFTPEGNAATVTGVDTAGRGYRDDVWQLIHDKYSSVPVVQANAEDAARYFQKSISPDTLAMADTSSVILESAQSAGCLMDRAGRQYGLQVIEATKAIYARTFNTDARLAARQAFLKAAKNVVTLDYDPKKCGVQP